MSISIQGELCVRLSRVRGLGLKRFHRLYDALGSVQKIRDADYSGLVNAGLETPLAKQVLAALRGDQSESYLDSVRRWVSMDSHAVVCIDDPQYPLALRELYRAPPVLYLKGDLSRLNATPALAIVGSRKPSLQGVRHATKISAELAGTHFNIVSGLALGVDGAAHQGALKVQGMTSAVLATGLDTVYPRVHESLAAEIAERGVLVSEMPLGTLPRPANFPRRNRLISGLSKGVLVVEAGLKSGSLITASYALEQNRDVFAVPGSIDNPMASGCHALLKQGARLVESAQDIFDEYGLSVPETGGISSSPGERPLPNHLSTAEASILDVMGVEMLSFDDLKEATGMTAPFLSQSLVELELKGVVKPVSGGYQCTKALEFPA